MSTAALAGFANGLGRGLFAGDDIAARQRAREAEALAAGAGSQGEPPAPEVEASAPPPAESVASPRGVYPPATDVGFRPSGVDPRVAAGIRSAAEAVGVDPVDLATAISYETAGTFDPLKTGPTTRWGRHRGLIQFGEPQAREHGVDWSSPVDSQLGPDGAVARYLRASGVKPGMGLSDIYSAINAGAPGRYGASDAAAGGAPGTVADKVAGMGDHRRKAQSLLRYYEIADPSLHRVPAASGRGVLP